MFVSVVMFLVAAIKLQLKITNIQDFYACR